MMNHTSHSGEIGTYSMKTSAGGFGRYGKWILGVYAEHSAAEAPSWIGTAFILSDQYALTAWHTISDYLKQFTDIDEEQLRHYPITVKDMSITLLQINLDGADDFAYDPDSTKYFSSIAVKKFYRIPGTDLGILEFDGIPLVSVLGLSLRMPPIGAKVTCAGYTDMNMIYPLVPPEKRKEMIALKFTAVMSECTVVATHLYKHSEYHPFPSFELEGEILGGMSGGPVFYNGRIVGVCTASLKANFSESPDAHPWSIVSTLHPLKKFFMRIPHRRATKENNKSKKITFLGLLKRTGIDIET